MNFNSTFQLIPNTPTSPTGATCCQDFCKCRCFSTDTSKILPSDFKRLRYKTACKDSRWAAEYSPCTLRDARKGVLNGPLANRTVATASKWWEVPHYTLKETVVYTLPMPVGCEEKRHLNVKHTLVCSMLKVPSQKPRQGILTQTQPTNAVCAVISHSLSNVFLQVSYAVMQTSHIQISSTVSSPFPRTSQRKYAQYNIVFVPRSISCFLKKPQLLTFSLWEHISRALLSLLPSIRCRNGLLHTKTCQQLPRCRKLLKQRLFDLLFNARGKKKKRRTQKCSIKSIKAHFRSNLKSCQRPQKKEVYWKQFKMICSSPTPSPCQSAPFALPCAVDHTSITQTVQKTEAKALPF